MITKMNPEVKKKWIDALRSGNYEQGRGTLIEENTDKTRQYCCLGVLADIIAPEKIASKLRPGHSYLTVDGAHAVLTPEVCQRAGLSYEIQDELTMFNDTKRRSFKWIAAYIERYL